MQALRRDCWQAVRQLGLPVGHSLLQALTTTLLQADWQAIMAPLGQVRSVRGSDMLSVWGRIATSRV